ncbi:alpha/beta-tubulin-N-acetyltransferase 9 isoform X4 [Desmodus rotundus]|uniref:alpha/beta-tubulin-N-acetyltransferase 9 isoform X4 n=1 Tax=Desmodus rotundus TaxID=9430 RepID=UPI0023819322|nr:alpha/beta-tubulin-N-acetyltransferase 9 isoform X4 [Desmodus rotundus]
MRLNQNILLLGKKVVLVPYTAEHVPRYHEWMKSEELQRLTASEPLTLEQEYAMQRSWREDADKCTFIVLDAERWQAQPDATEESCMAGDVNLFLTDLGDPSLGEVEVMIAGVNSVFGFRVFKLHCTPFWGWGPSDHPQIADLPRSIFPCCRRSLSSFCVLLGP